ncbi:MAG: ABC transporter permease [Deltaproteobacteria bacterium]|nr:ABC transporter permease [Deltaproteobacteria bacterium]
MPSRPGARYRVATVTVLVVRDLKRLLRQPSRLAGAIGQPLVFWLVLGGGFAGTFHLPGAPVGYLEYFYPGVLAMVVLFSAIFGAMSLIEDRREGFLQAVLAGPGSRASVALGKILGGSAVALLQALVFLALAPWAGFEPATIAWGPLLALLALAALALTGVGFALAWWIDSTQGYHAVVSLLLIPLWVLSGAMFPAAGSVLSTLMRLNPVAYVVDGLRRALYGGLVPATVGLESSLSLDIAMAGAFAIMAFAAAAVVCRRR